MILNINKKQYRKLVELLALAESDIDEFVEHGALEQEEYDDYQLLLQSIFKHSAKIDCEDAIEYSPETKDWGTTDDLLEYWYGFKPIVEMNIFKEHLAFYMARKQVFLNHSSSSQLPDEDVMREEIHQLADQYHPIIEQNGLGLLEWVSRDTLQKQYPNANIEAYLVTESLSLNPEQSQALIELLNDKDFDIEALLNDSDLYDEPHNTTHIQAAKNANHNVIDFPIKQNTDNQASTLQLKIMLQGSKPPIWRRFEVTNSINLMQLHHIIQDAFSLFDYHLHEFSLNNQVVDENQEQQITLAQIYTQTEHLEYTYDFGDNWEFTIILEKTKAQKNQGIQAICTAGKRGDIIEDIGGVPMMNHLAQTLKQGQPLPEYLAEFYDPILLKEQLETFDKNQINQNLKTLTRAW